MPTDRERRRSFRIEVGATACIWDRGHYCGGYPVSDLSLGGCCIEDGPDCALGQELELSLHLPELQRDLHVPVRVMRRQNHTLGLRFVESNAGVEDTIHDLLMNCLEGEFCTSGHLLVIHPDPQEVPTLISTLKGQGHRVHLASNPLQMVWSLENHSANIHCAIVSRSLGLADGLDIIDFLAVRYPQIRRILLADTSTESASTPIGQAHAVLPTPFNVKRLRQVLPTRMGIQHVA